MSLDGNTPALVMITDSVVDQLRAEDVSKEDDDFVFGIIFRGRGDVGVDAVDFFPFACA